MRIAVWPILRSSNGRALIDFLCEAFGFEESFVFPSGDGKKIVHAQLSWPLGGGIMLGDIGMHDFEVGHTGPSFVYLVTDQPDALYKRSTSAGAKIVHPLVDRDSYESREFSVKDPEGNVWSLEHTQENRTARQPFLKYELRKLNQGQ